MNLKAKNQKQVYSLILITGFLLCSFYIMSRSCPSYSNQRADLPYYLDQVWPPSNEEIPLGCYIRGVLKIYNRPIPQSTGSDQSRSLKPSNGVSVTIFPHLLKDEMSSSSNGNVATFRDRVTLYVDEKATKTISVEKGEITINGNSEDAFNRHYVPQWYYFGAYPILLPGDHVARFVIVKKNGELLEYEWKFTITWW